MTDTESVKVATNEAADAARDNRAHRKLLALSVTGCLGVLLLGGAVLWLLGHISQQDAQISHLRDAGNDTASQSQQLAAQVRNLGATPVVQPAQPAPAGPTIITAVPIPGPGPTQAQIDDAVTEYIAAHPPAAGKPATPEMVATAVAEFLTAHPPTPGRPPTPEEIATAAATWFATHSAEFRGAAGKDATDAQIAASVDAYCSAHNKCSGPAGATGQQGQPGKTGATGATGQPGPTCPSGYELRDAVITSPDGSTYRGKACVDPATSKPPGPIPVR